jgi:hypothetical protein
MDAAPLTFRQIAPGLIERVNECWPQKTRMDSQFLGYVLTGHGEPGVSLALPADLKRDTFDGAVLTFVATNGTATYVLAPMVDHISGQTFYEGTLRESRDG